MTEHKKTFTSNETRLQLTSGPQIMLPSSSLSVSEEISSVEQVSICTISSTGYEAGESESFSSARSESFLETDVSHSSETRVQTIANQGQDEDVMTIVGKVLFWFCFATLCFTLIFFASFILYAAIAGGTLTIRTKNTTLLLNLTALFL